MSSLSHKVLLDRLYGTIYGNCIGDAIGLLTEFMNKTKAISVSAVSVIQNWKPLKCLKNVDFVYNMLWPITDSGYYWFVSGEGCMFWLKQ